MINFILREKRDKGSTKPGVGGDKKADKAGYILGSEIGTQNFMQAKKMKTCSNILTSRKERIDAHCREKVCHSF